MDLLAGVVMVEFTFFAVLASLMLTLHFEIRSVKGPNSFRVLITDLQKRVAELEAAAGKNNPDSDS